MENEESVRVEALEALLAIITSLVALSRTVAAIQVHPPASPYGPYVDAVALKGAAYWAVREAARAVVRIAAIYATEEK
ncbi:hypothetical protein [Arthrobacter sp. S39]|uniref:hypothetical protein n=1 Tax=Arthrobacter sp. S39 TaxID=2509720 RepID=UPI001038010E|nr:hypothetical protein [Arthrobacter sp. S39]TAP43494.1 hypothetical protein EYS21_11630 [Arthrobacter sp. S39]